MKQRGITSLEVIEVLQYPSKVERSYDEKLIAKGKVNNRELNVVFVRRKRYLKIITVR